MDRLITIEEIKNARAALPPAIRETPILPFAADSPSVGEEKLYLKAENLQVTGAYKVRAAFTILNGLTASERKRGVVLTSSGNFAQAFGFAGAQMGVPIVVVMLDQTSPYKIEATRAYGAEVVFSGNDALARQPFVEQIAAERSMTPIDTWEDQRGTRGHASIGLEILEQMPDVKTVLVPVSSGGVASGVATAIKETNPSVKVIGVQPERANAAYVSLQKGVPTAIDYWNTIADGLSAVRPGFSPFRHLQKYLDGIVLISEADIARAFRSLLMRTKIMAEPAGAVAAAAFLSGSVDTSRKTVACVTGGNVTVEMAQRMLEMANES
ncbi:MAG: pyridoxal-phosphate dependent enzyme [Nitrospinaceae bacterium]|nr:pyridoxal-phosphate dependent enzyme [Nitrospinaceae bacterium]